MNRVNRADVFELRFLRRRAGLERLVAPLQRHRARRYHRAHFHGPFREGEGIEQIFAHLSRLVPEPLRWLDVGAGAHTLFWSLALRPAGTVMCADLHSAPGYLLRRMIATRRWPQCYEDMAERLGLTIQAHLERVCERLDGYLIFDAFAPWPPAVDGGNFDLVTQFGCFGLAKDREQFVSAIHSALDALAPGGVLIGANWSRRGSNNEGFPTFLTPQVLRSAARPDAMLLHADQISLRDAQFDSVLVSVFRREAG